MPSNSFPLIDMRCPGSPMVGLPLKLPADLVEALQNRAERLQCSRGALARALVCRGLAELETAAAAWGETTPEDDELAALAEEGRRVLAAA
jgi:hypothetical protein